MRTLRISLGAGAAGLALGWTSLALAQTPAAAPDPAPAATAPAPDADGLGEGVVASPPPEAPAEPPPPAAGPPPAPPTISEAIAAGKLILEVRGRYEMVDQTRTAALTRKGEAYTVRTRLGWETADWNGFKALIEMEDVRLFGPEHYAVNVPGATTPPLNGASHSKYPLINDPKVTELNRLQLTWTPNAMMQATIGRQRILLDDQRFVGNVGWRQDEQTFDAVRLDLAWRRFKMIYVYVNRANRVLGEMRDWDSDSHLLNVTWSPAEQLRLQGFVYALDFENSRPNVSLTKGIKGSGKTWVGLVQLAYNATYARQTDWRHATAPYGLNYYSADLAGTFDIWTGKVGYEVLEGNGVRGFTTPLATTHAFNGWSDAFVQALGGNKSFVDGIKDLNFTLNVKPRYKWTYLSAIDLIVRYHDFRAERTGAPLGHEWDAQIQAAINPKLSMALKYADFERVGRARAGTAAPPPSRKKFWVTLEYRL